VLAPEAVVAWADRIVSAALADGATDAEIVLRAGTLSRTFVSSDGTISARMGVDGSFAVRAWAQGRVGAVTSNRLDLPAKLLVRTAIENARRGPVAAARPPTPLPIGTASPRALTRARSSTARGSSSSAAS
jgi:predicted Zn-dependent protease